MNSTTLWWSDFFTGLTLDVQRGIYNDAATAADVETFLKLAEPAAGAAVLDVPCGNGRISLELAARGFRATGVDLTAALIADARAAAESRGLAVDWRCADMRDLPWSSTFDAALCFGNSFAYMNDAGNTAFLAAVYRTLRPGGTFVLQTNLAAESMFATQPGRKWYAVGDCYLLNDGRYDAAAGEWESRYTFIRGTQHEKRSAVYRIYTCRQIVDLLRAAGFASVETYASGAREAFGIGSAGLYLVTGRE